MKNAACALVLGAALVAVPSLAAAPAQAGEREFAFDKLTCKEFLQDKQNRREMVVWLEGYRHGQATTLTMSEEWIRLLHNDLEEYCGKHPDNTIRQAIEDIPVG